MEKTTTTAAAYPGAVFHFRLSESRQQAGTNEARGNYAKPERTNQSQSPLTWSPGLSRGAEGITAPS